MSKYCLMKAARSRSTVSASSIASRSLLPLALQPPNSFLEVGVDEDVKGIGALAEIVGGPSSHDDAVAGFGDSGKNSFHHLANAFRIDHLQPRRIQAAFKTASHEGLEQAVVCRVSFLLMLLDRAAFAIQTARDFLSQRLIPKLPAQPRGQLRRQSRLRRFRTRVPR